MGECSAQSNICPLFIYMNFNVPELGTTPCMGVYKITFDSRHFYIGGSTDLRVRFNGWKTRLKSKVPKNKNILALLDECNNVCFEIVELVIDKTKVKQREDFFIKDNFLDPLCLNRCPSAYNNKGIKLTIGERENLRLNAMLGKQHIFTEEEIIEKRKLAVVKGICQKVVVFDKNMVLLKQYDSIAETERCEGVKRDVINLIIKGIRKTSKGLIFRKQDKDGNVIEPIIENKKRGRVKGFNVASPVKLKIKEKLISRYNSNPELFSRGLMPKKIEVYNSSGALFNIYNSITKAAKGLGTESGNICAVLNGKRKTCKGMTFKLAQE